MQHSYWDGKTKNRKQKQEDRKITRQKMIIRQPDDLKWPAKIEKRWEGRCQDFLDFGTQWCEQCMYSSIYLSECGAGFLIHFRILSASLLPESNAPCTVPDEDNKDGPYINSNCEIGKSISVFGEGAKKRGYFTVRLTVSVYPPPLTVSF